MSEVGPEGHPPFDNKGMLVNNLVYQTNFSQRSHLWHPSYLNSESYYSNNNGVDGSRCVSQKEFSVYQMICDEQISQYCIRNVTAL